MKKLITIIILNIIILFSVNNTEAQNVGVSDVTFTPQGMLHVYKSTAGPSSLFQITDVTSGNAATNGLTFDFDASFNINLNNRQNTSFGLSTNGTTRMTISSGGYIGVNVAPSTSYQFYATSASTTADNATIYGAATGNARTYGVLGTTTSTTTNGSGIRGYASGATGATNGIWGEAASSSGSGVYGLATNAAGDGIYGLNSAVAGGGIGSGVYGYSDQALGAGIYGDGGTNSAGVFGVSAKKHVWNSAIYGENSNSTSGTSWSYDQVTCGVAGRATGTAFYATGIYGYNNNSVVNNNAAVFAEDGQGYIAGLTFTFTPGATQRTLGVYGRGTGGADDRAIQGEWGTAATAPWGYIGGTDVGVFGQNPGATAGTAYDATINAIEGQTQGDAAYNFGVLGYDLGATNRTGGVLGAYSGAVWSSNGYRSSAGSLYGLYSSATTYNGTTNTNGGFMNEINVQFGIGIGSFGGIIGGWTRGEVMGQISAGEMFASYNLGNAYTSGYSAEIVTLKDKRVAAYSVTSTDIKVYHDGTSKLSKGRARVNFEQSFTELIGDNKPIVTVTPMGQCNGIYISIVDSKGFEVSELNNGNTSVEFSYIIIGKRIDAKDKPELPEALSKKDFDEKMKGVMFNESNLELNATPIWWDGTKIRFEKTPEKINKEKKFLKKK